MKKLRKNKLLAIIICVIVVSVAYFGAQKAINNYNFYNDDSIITEEEFEQNAGENKGDESWNGDKQSLEGSGNFSNEEIDLVLEEDESSEGMDEGSINNEIEDENATSLGNNETGDSKEVFEKKKIYVYITGEVNSPGVVILDEGSRIVDAINAAGGTTVKANVSKVNLVYSLEDGMKVNIPNNDDLKNDPDFEYITMNSGDGINDDYLRDKGDSFNATSSSERSSSSLGSGSSYSIVNINTATQTELESLPGIGPSLALRIIDYRKENGKFSSIEEIKNVSGIGDSKFESLKAYITV